MEIETDILHVLDFPDIMFMSYKRELITQLHQDVLDIIDYDLTPLLLLEAFLPHEFTLITKVPTNIDIALEAFGIRNLCHGVFRLSFTN